MHLIGISSSFLSRELRLLTCVRGSDIAILTREIKLESIELHVVFAFLHDSLVLLVLSMRIDVGKVDYVSMQICLWSSAAEIRNSCKTK